MHVLETTGGGGQEVLLRDVGAGAGGVISTD